MKKMKKLNTKLSHWYFLFLSIFLNGVSYASDQDPFPAIDTGGKDILHATGGFMDTMLKYITIGLGGLLIVIAIGVLYSRLREDSKDREHGNMVMTMIIVAVVAVVGFVLIGIGWSAFNVNVS